MIEKELILRLKIPKGATTICWAFYDYETAERIGVDHETVLEDLELAPPKKGDCLGCQYANEKNPWMCFVCVRAEDITDKYLSEEKEAKR